MQAQQIEKIIRGIVLRETEIYDMVYFYGDQDRIASILAEIENTCKKHDPAAKVIRMDAEAFLGDTVWAFEKGTFYVPQCECDLYVFENIEQIAGREINEQRLYGIFDWLLENGRQIIVTGAVPTANIGSLAPRICAQLDGGVSFRIEPACD